MKTLWSYWIVRFIVIAIIVLILLWLLGVIIDATGESMGIDVGPIHFRIGDT